MINFSFIMFHFDSSSVFPIGVQLHFSFLGILLVKLMEMYCEGNRSAMREREAISREKVGKELIKGSCVKLTESGKIRVLHYIPALHLPLFPLLTMGGRNKQKKHVLI